MKIDLIDIEKFGNFKSELVSFGANFNVYTYNKMKEPAANTANSVTCLTIETNKATASLLFDPEPPTVELVAAT